MGQSFLLNIYSLYVAYSLVLRFLVHFFDKEYLIENFIVVLECNNYLGKSFLILIAPNGTWGCWKNFTAYLIAYFVIFVLELP